MTGFFFAGYPWRFVVTDLDIAVVTWAQGLLTDRKIMLNLGQPTVIDAAVDPDDIRVNGLWTDGYPRLNRSNRIIFGFRRSGPQFSSLGSPWSCEAAGIIMSNEDEGDENVPLTHVTAYDPRRLLDARPVMDDDGSLPTSDNPLPFPGMTAGEIGLTCLKNTIENEGGVFIDAGVAWGGTASWGGVIETTEEVEYEAQPGAMVGDVWNDLEATGKVEFVLRPIYDPSRSIVVDGNTYRFTHELSVYVLAGDERPTSVFSWGRLNRNLDRVSRMQDATPANFFNKALYYAGQGGLPVPLTGPSVPSGTMNAASVADFGAYWAMQFFPQQTGDDPSMAAVLNYAQLQLRLVKQGQRTLALSPIPERAPIPLDEYEPGDRVPVYVARTARQITEGYLRVQSIPIQVNDSDAYETVNGFVASPDWPTPGS